MKRLVLRTLLFFMGSLIFAFPSANAQTGAECRIAPSQLNETATLVLRDFAEADGSLPDRMVIGNTVQVSSAEEGSPGGVRAVHEAFYRPLEDATYALLPLPLFGVEVTRDRHVLYLCGRTDTGRNVHDLTIYVMKGYHMDPSSLGTIFGNIFHAAEIKVTPVSVSPINISQLNNGFLGIFRRIPLIGQLLQLPQIPLAVAQAIAGRLTAEFAGLGVERIVLTETYLELAVGVDLNNPSQARKIRRIDLKKARNAGDQPSASSSTEALTPDDSGNSDIIYDPTAMN